MRSPISSAGTSSTETATRASNPRNQKFKLGLS
jgi:hypothetical protein